LQVNDETATRQWVLDQGYSGGGGVADGDKGDVTVSGGGAVWTVDAGVVTNAKLANMATARFKGRVTGGTGDPEDLTGTQATTLLDTFTSALKGLAPASGGGTANFLRADGSWAAPGGGIGGLATITVPNSRVEWEETVTATGVTGTSRIMLSLAPALDSDENDPSFLDVMNMSAAPGTGQMTVSMAFRVPAAGPIKLNWSAM